MKVYHKVAGFVGLGTKAVGMSNFRQVDRQTGFLLTPSVDEWLTQRHLARFVVEVIKDWVEGPCVRI